MQSKSPREIQNEKLRQVDCLLNSSFIGMETKPSNILHRDQVLRAKLMVGKKAEIKSLRSPKVDEEVSTEIDKRALELVNEYMELQDSQKEQKAQDTE